MTQKLNFFGKSLMLAVIVAITINVSKGFSQEQNSFSNWKTSGSIITEGDFFGSINDQDLVFKINNVERMRLTTDNYTILKDKLRVYGPLYIGENSLLIEDDILAGPYITERVSSNRDAINFLKREIDLEDYVYQSNIRIGVGLEKPEHQMHLHQEPGIDYPVIDPTVIGFTNDITGITPNDGFLVGINTDGTALLNQQENKDFNIRLGKGEDNESRIHISGDEATLGFVGIGTTTPNNTIQVKDLINFDNDAFSTFLGFEAGLVNTGEWNTAIGYGTLSSNTSGEYNTAVGSQTLLNNTTGYKNTAFGSNVLAANTSGHTNIAIGTDVLAENTVGQHNIAIGNVTLPVNTTGKYNIAVGMGSLYLNTDGKHNTALGNASLQSNITGSSNTAVGFKADVGNGALLNATAIGVHARVDASNSMVLGAIEEIGCADFTVKVGIGTTEPQNRLEITAEPTELTIDNQSGLRLSNLRSTADTESNPGDGVLSVNQDGDVIYVEAMDSDGAALGNICGDEQNPLDESWEIPLDGHNFVFTGQESEGSRVGIGTSCNNILAKLDVRQQHDILGISSTITSQETGSTAIIGRSSLADNQVGVLGLVRGGTQQAGVRGRAGDGLRNNYGVYGHAFNHMPSQGAINYGGFFQAWNGNLNYGVYAEVQETTESSFAGYFNGNVNIIGDLTFEPSDEMLKDSISDINDALSIIRNLSPRTFVFKTEEYDYINLSKGTRYGLIAQEVDSILPEVVKQITHPTQYDTLGNEISPELTFNSITYTSFIPIALSAIKELDDTIQGITRVPDPPTLIEPIDEDTVYRHQHFRFRWHKADYAANYMLYIAFDQEMEDIFSIRQFNDTLMNYSLDFSQDTVLYWAVKSINVFGEKSEFSEIRELN